MDLSMFVYKEYIVFVRNCTHIQFFKSIKKELPETCVKTINIRIVNYDIISKELNMIKNEEKHLSAKL